MRLWEQIGQGNIRYRELLEKMPPWRRKLRLLVPIELLVVVVRGSLPISGSLVRAWNHEAFYG